MGPRATLLAPCLAAAIASVASLGAPAPTPSTQPPATQPARFQGVVEMKLEMEGGSGRMRLLVSGDNPVKARLELDALVSGVNGPVKMAIIQDGRSPDSLLLVDDRRKIYSGISLAEAARLTQTEPAGGKYKVKVLGKGQVLNHPCVHVALTRDKELVDAWVTKDLMDVYQVLRKLQEADPQVGEAAVFRALESAGHAGLPMRYTVIREGQKVTTEVSKVERRAVSDAELAVPGDYARGEAAAAPSATPQPKSAPPAPASQGAAPKRKTP